MDVNVEWSNDIISNCVLASDLFRTKMADVSDTTVYSDIFVDDIKTAIKAIKESKKRPDTKAI